MDREYPPPRFPLDRVETNHILEYLGFYFDRNRCLYDNPSQRARFQALQELISGAILQWEGLKLSDEELEGAKLWVQEWLVG